MLLSLIHGSRRLQTGEKSKTICCSDLLRLLPKDVGIRSGLEKGSPFAVDLSYDLLGGAGDLESCSSPLSITE